MKKKIGILTIISMIYSKIVYAILNSEIINGALYAPPVEPIYEIPVKNTVLDVLLKIGKIAILPIILLIGIVVIVKIKRNKSKM